MSSTSKNSDLHDIEDLLEQGLASLRQKPKLLQDLAVTVNTYIDRMNEMPQMAELPTGEFNSEREKLQHLLLLASLHFLIGLFNKTQSELEQANLSYEEVLGLLTHEFKNLLSTLDGYHGIIEEDLTKLGQRKLLETHQAGNRIVKKLFNILDSILRFYQSDRKLLKPEYKLTDFEEDILDPLEEELGIDLKNRQMRLKRSSKGPRKMIDLDPQLIEIALRNLIENAVKYSQPGSNIEIHHASSENELFIRVKSYNKEIPKNLCSNIFEKFKTKKIGDVKTGTGIGLYNVRNIIHLHQGSIKCHSKAGKWIEFVISIPAISSEII